ncbi:MAG TPA: hypothetical protein VED19_01120, partial [Candidatus Nitrosopolaris sp.]|nr:hypothetical protein [Candidatus Nitrosopolaris sp.]
MDKGFPPPRKVEAGQANRVKGLQPHAAGNIEYSTFNSAHRMNAGRWRQNFTEGNEGNEGV